MKFTADDYATLESAVLPYMKLSLVANYTEEVSNLRRRWDALWAATGTGALPWSVLSGYLNAHIDTALRKVERIARSEIHTAPGVSA